MSKCGNLIREVGGGWKDVEPLSTSNQQKSFFVFHYGYEIYLLYCIIIIFLTEFICIILLNEYNKLILYDK